MKHRYQSSVSVLLAVFLILTALLGCSVQEPGTAPSSPAASAGGSETPAPAVVETPAPAAPVLSSPQDADSATSMLALAQRVHDEYVRDGEEQSAKIIAEAKAERESIIAEAHKQKDNVLKQLEQERELLENKINGLRTFESEYRTNLRTHLESLLNEVGNGEN